jgi:hypothetical protein
VLTLYSISLQWAHYYEAANTAAETGWPAIGWLISFPRRSSARQDLYREHAPALQFRSNDRARSNLVHRWEFVNGPLVFCTTSSMKTTHSIANPWTYF